MFPECYSVVPLTFDADDLIFAFFKDACRRGVGRQKSDTRGSTKVIIIRCCSISISNLRPCTNIRIGDD